MNDKYILSIDQSTSGTKALIFDYKGELLSRYDLPHKQIVNELGWIEHNPKEIYSNTLEVVKKVIKKNNINKNNIIALGISNQRETVLVWDKDTGEPVYNAIVWQCSRGKQICDEIKNNGYKDLVKSISGLNLSPYFSAAKISWILKNIDGLENKNLCCGTIDSWLIYNLTNKKSFKTEYSNASRTQLFDIKNLNWSDELCNIFDIKINTLPKVINSDGDFGETDFDGYLDKKIPIRAVIGDSQGALFAQGCVKKGMAKATYGTGSSIMMNTGENPLESNKGIVTSIAWKINNKVNYVLEGNINYTGALINWLQNDLELINSPEETENLAFSANQDDITYIVPAFSGLGSPYWKPNAKAIICGMTRTTKKAEIAKASLEAIAYQIKDIINIMIKESNIVLNSICVDGGSTKNKYLMQFQSDILNIPINIPQYEELSGMGAAFIAGFVIGIYKIETLFKNNYKKIYNPSMDLETIEKKYKGWIESVEKIL